VRDSPGSEPRLGSLLNPAQQIFGAPAKLANRIFAALAALEASLIETFQPLWTILHRSSR